MESLLNKYNTSIHSRMRSGHNKENQAPTGGQLRSFRNYSNGPIGIPFKAKNSNNLNFHNHGMSNLLRNQTTQYHHFDKLNIKNSINNGLNLNLNGLNNNSYLRKSNASYSSDDGINSFTSNGSLFTITKAANTSSLSNSFNNNCSQNKLNDLYKSQLSSSSSSLSYSSNGDSLDKRLPPPPKQNIMYHEQRFVVYIFFFISFFLQFLFFLLIEIYLL